MMEPKKWGEDTDCQTKFGLCTPIPIVGAVHSSFRVLAILPVHSACTTLAIALLSFPSTVTSQRLTFSVKSCQRGSLSRLSGARASQGIPFRPFGWGNKNHVSAIRWGGETLPLRDGARICAHYYGPWLYKSLTFVCVW